MNSATGAGGANVVADSRHPANNNTLIRNALAISLILSNLPGRRHLGRSDLVTDGTLLATRLGSPTHGSAVRAVVLIVQ